MKILLTIFFFCNFLVARKSYLQMEMYLLRVHKLYNMIYKTRYFHVLLFKVLHIQQRFIYQQSVHFLIT